MTLLIMLELTLEVRDVTKANKVVGIGTTLHKFVDDNGKDVYLPSTIDGANVCMRLRGRRHNITIPLVCGGTNLPCVYNSFVS